MKSLVIVALVSMFSYANASVDLSCISTLDRADKKRNSSVSVLTKESGKFKVVKTMRGSSSKPRKEITILNVVGKAEKNTTGEFIYTGVAETQVQVDTFMKSLFVLRIPQDLSSNAGLSFENQDGEVLEQVSFKCIRPDNR